MAVLKDLKLVEPNLDQSSSNRELSSWLFDQAFKPQNSFPVFGMLETTHHLKPVKEFGRIQKILLEQLSRHDPEEDSLEASILIIQSWYREFHPQIWEHINNNQDGYSPEIYLLLALYKSIGSGSTGECDQEDEKFTDWDSLGSLKIPDLSRFPVTMKPERFLERHLSGDGSIEPSKDLLVFGSTDFVADSIQVEGLSVRIRRYKHRSEDTPSNFKYRIRVGDGSPTDGRLRTIVSKFNLLDTHLSICHREIIHQLKSKGNWVPDDALKSFSQWFKDILLGTEGNSLAIIGDIEKEEDGEFQLDEFGEVQIYLVNQYLGHPMPYSRVIWVSLVLLEYWYRMFHSECFFPTSNDYWNSMIKSLGIKLDHAGRYSLVKYDDQGNFVGRVHRKKSLRSKRLASS
ncbi:hypothetical protein PGT21_003897 [Puccinia graminis f. sp. tritici]|uniref:Uncharacterized protein n=1 Tax=Puccinia graminis f. sp. tritici TaxID=56615 RepID=A0A5B0RGF0_PUCGR|nr:hypothetical protein PGT21_003897 [Puccinia graminis f. sp. tritici]KAA1123794.1 hypothetical protein PGTUg99_019998 [Puccinia graminis f. sp. tritici]